MKHFLPKSRHFAWAFFWLLTTTIGWGQTLINESFESTTFPPTNWSNSSSGWVRSTNSARTGSASAASNGVNDALTTPLLVNPNQLSFWYRRSTNTAAWELIVDVSSSLSGPWTTVKTISSVTTTYQEETTDLSSFQNIYVRFRDNRSSGTAERYIDDVVVTELLPPILTINNNGTQVTTGNVNQGAVNHLLSTFQVGVATANATLNQVSFAASGNFTAGDVTSFKLFTNNTNTFPGGTPLATVDATSIANGGTVTFGSLSQTCAIGDRYFWVAADVSATATPNNTIGVPSLSTSNFTFASGSVSGTIDAGGTQTIVEVTPQITLSSPSASVANLTQGINNQAFYRFDLAVTTANTTLNGVTITTAGTYSASDLTNIKCWYSADTSFDAGSDVLLSTKTTSLEAGIQVFPSFTNQLITSGTTGYIFITVDVPLNAVAGNTISVDAITTTDLSFITGNVTGTANASGTKTITNCTPTNATGLALTPGNGQIIVNWTNPVCFDEVLIVAKATTSITANPTGDGTLYNANLTFGTGDAFDSGFVVYKGTTSPQTITGLTNGTTYFVKIFTRRGTDWSSGVESSAVPQLQNATAIIYLSSSSTTWLTAANWTGGSIPNGTQVAQFSENPTSGLLGINFNGTTNAGVQVNGQKIQEAGAIEVNSSRTSNMSIGNSSTTAGATGQLRLNGVIVNATENVVIRNNSSQSVTIQNIQGSGNQTMVVLLNNFVNNLFDVDGSGDIIITSSITSASGPVTISGSGSGIVEFGGQNTYTTATNVNSSTLRLNRSGGTTIPTSNEVIVNGGTLRISTNQTLSNLTLTSGGLTVDAGATLTLNQNITIPDDFTITNNGTIVIQGTLTDNRTTKSFDGTVSFNGSSQQTIAAATTFSNLTINNTAGVKASGDITVNGVLNLASANPNATDGALDMVIAYGTYGTVSKLDPNNFNSTLEHNNLNSYVLNLGATATVTGVGDVTGKVSRTQTFVNNTTYAFSNANMTLNFNDGGSASNLPTKITVISTRGTKGLHADKDVADNGNPAIGGAAVLRLWQILRTDGAAAARFTVRFPYEEAELNGNTEGNLVTWDHHLDNPAYEGITPHEHGKTNNDATNNFVELANHSLFYLTTEGSTTNTKYWMLSDQITTNNTWLGAADIPAGQSNWNSTSNWTSGVAPTANDHVVIEPVGVAARNPEFVSGSYSFGSMEIKSGAEVDAGAATITLNNGPASNGNVAGSWLNNGTFNAGTSTVIFNAGVDNLATLAGNTNFHHITVNTGKTLRLEQNAVMGVAGTLTVNGALDATQSENTVVFNGTTDQTVPATTTDNTSAAYHTLELAGAGVKSFEATPSIKGNLIKSGTSTVTIPSQFNFNGTTAQSIAGFDYNNIEFSEAGTKTFTSAASVSPTAAITFTGTPGAVDFDGSSNNLTFVLKSDTNGTARVADASNWNLNGKVTAERFVPNRRAWRLLTAPTKGSTSNTVQDNWQGTNGEGVLLWGPSGTGLAVGPQNNIYSYNGAWTPVTNTTTTNLFDTDKNNAFLVFAVGPHGGNNIASTNAAVETTLRPKGSLITGNVNYTGLTTNAFQLIANPYASPISTSALKTTNPDFNIWLLDPSLGAIGGYYTFDGSNWTPTTPTIENTNIQSGQGFFVRSASASSFTINESHKAVGNSNTWFDKPSVQTTEENKIRVLLDKQENNQWQLVDGILSVSGNNYANAVDAQDALKVSNFNENILFRNGTSNLAIEYQNMPTTATEQPIRLTGTTATAYRLRVKTEGFVSVNVQPILQDTQSGTNHLIPTDGSTIEIPFTGVVATTTNPDQRFKIVYQQVLGVEQPITNTLQVYPNPVREGQFTVVLPNPTEVATYEITNYLGQVVQKGELAPSNSKVSVAHQAAGVYLVKMQQNGLVYTTKIVKK